MKLLQKIKNTNELKKSSGFKSRLWSLALLTVRSKRYILPIVFIFILVIRKSEKTVNKSIRRGEKVDFCYIPRKYVLFSFELLDAYKFLTVDTNGSYQTGGWKQYI